MSATTLPLTARLGPPLTSKTADGLPIVVVRRIKLRQGRPGAAVLNGDAVRGVDCHSVSGRDAAPEVARVCPFRIRRRQVHGARRGDPRDDAGGARGAAWKKGVAPVKGRATVALVLRR